MQEWFWLSLSFDLYHLQLRSRILQNSKSDGRSPHKWQEVQHRETQDYTGDFSSTRDYIPPCTHFRHEYMGAGGTLMWVLGGPHDGRNSHVQDVHHGRRHLTSYPSVRAHLSPKHL